MHLMLTLRQHDYNALVTDAAVLSRDRWGDKVLRLPDGRIVKLFRPKRLLSSSVLWPYAKRFVSAARKLTDLSIPTVKVEAAYVLPHLRRHAVVYQPLPGQSLRDSLRTNPIDANMWHAFAGFVAILHDRGVFFRGMHLGNVLVLPHDEKRQVRDAGFGLIDLSEARFRRRPLPPRLRARNFKPMLRYKEDIEAMQAFGVNRFIDAYLSSAGLSTSAVDQFRKWLRRFGIDQSAMRASHQKLAGQ